MIGRPAWRILVAALFLEAASGGAPAAAQNNAYGLLGANVRRAANGIVGVLGLSVTPDTTASSITINSGDAGNVGLNMIQFGSGFTVAEGFPLYLEGFLGYARYDPKFLLTNGQSERVLPTRWNNFSGTVGVGWDFPFPFVEDLVFRPILNVSMAHVASDLAIGGRYIQLKTNLDLDFLENGRMNVMGGGGSLMLDYMHYRDDYELDVEVRATWIRLTTIGDTAAAVRGTADAITLGVWSQLSVPTGIRVCDLDIRAIGQAAYSNLQGDQRGALGFDYLVKAGAGVELDLVPLDIGAFGVYVRRLRLMGNVVVGENVLGQSIGLAIGW